MTYYEKICDMNVLYESFKKAKRESHWKDSVQHYELNLVRNLRQLQQELINKTYKPSPFYEFELNERGKTRWIKANTIRDRVVRHALCDYVLNPRLSKYIIYDSGASREGKGISFTRNRLDVHLHKFFRETGSNEGYILLMDYSKYYDNINHEKLINYFASKIDDKDVIDLIRKIVDMFKVDVSYMTPEEYNRCYDEKFDVIKYQQIDRSLLTGDKYMYKSIGIGDQISQTGGIFYLTQIDNYVKIVRGVKYYGRYMDDSYIISSDKKFLEDIAKDIDVKSKEIGLFLNHNKTHISKINRTFTFLKTRYLLTDTGKTIKKISGDNITRERRKLKTFRSKLSNGEMTYKEIEDQYRSWMGNYKKYLSNETYRNIENLYNELFEKEKESYYLEAEASLINRYNYDRYRRNIISKEVCNGETTL